MPKDLIRLVHALFQPAACCDAPWAPAADVYRTRRGWLVKVALAGVRPDDLELTADGNTLTVRGVRRDWVPDEGCRHYSMEIDYSRFERTVELPCDVGRANVSTDFRDGMLFVRIEPREA
jgi:HSP20 family protein